MRFIILVLSLFFVTGLSAQRDTLISGIKFHLVSDGDTGTAWIQQKYNKKGVESFRGWYIEYYHDGKLKAKGHYKNRKRCDDWTRYYENGQKSITGYYDGGYKSDLWQTFYENGKMSWKGSFYLDMRSGFWRYFYEDGKLKAMTRYRIHTEKRERKKTDKVKGISFKVNIEYTYSISPADSLVEYYPDGKLRTRIIYGKEGGMTGSVALYNENGKPNLQGTMYFGNKIGEWIYYCADGAVSFREKYTVDQKDPVEVKQETSCKYIEIEPWLIWGIQKITI